MSSTEYVSGGGRGHGMARDGQRGGWKRGHSQLVKGLEMARCAVLKRCWAMLSH